MLRHPTTGKPIVLLKQNGVLSKDVRRIVWCSTEADLHAAYRTAATIAIESIELFDIATTNNIPVFAYYCSDGNDIMRMLLTQNKPLLFIISRENIPPQFAQLIQSIGNVIVLEDIQTHLPFIAHHTFNILLRGDIHVMIGLVHRASHIITSETPSIGAMEAIKEYNIVHSKEQPKKEIWLVTQYFRPSAGRRAKEIDACLQTNMASGIFDRIVLLNETDAPMSQRILNSPGAEKLDVRNHGRRLTYGDVLNFSKEDMHSLKLDDIYIVSANADITFDKDRWKELHCLSLKSAALSILRHDMPEQGDENAQPKLFGFPGPSEESTDAWVFSAAAMKATGILEKPQVLDRFSAIQFGYVGCDQAFVGELMRNKIAVYNPAVHFRIFHHHNSNVNTSTKKVPDCQVFGHARVCGALDIMMDNAHLTNKYGTIERESVDVSLTSDNMKSVETFCIMAERGDRYKWVHDKPNTIKIPAIPVYEWTNAMISLHGQVQKYDRVIIGPTEESTQLSEKVGVASLQITNHIDTVWGIPIRQKTMNSVGRYFTEYMARALQFMDKFNDIDAPVILFPNSNGQEWINHFRWPNMKDKVGAVQWNERGSLYAKRVIGSIDGPWFNEISRSDIAALRRAFIPYVSSITKSSQITIVLGGFIDTQWATELKELFINKGYNPIIIDPATANVSEMIAAFCGTSQVLVSGGGAESGKGPVDYSSRTFWSWLMPAGARLIEIQNEFNPDGEVAALCAAADVVHMFIIIHRAPSAVQMKNVVGRMDTIFESFTVPEQEQKSNEKIIESISDITTLKFSV